MDTFKVIAKRKSCRGYDPQKLVSQADLEKIIAAGCAAAIGAKEKGTLHLTVLTDTAVMDSINKAVQEVMKMKLDFRFNAPVCVIVSASDKQLLPNIEYANAACLIENMLLAATDMGIDNLYIWGALTVIKNDAEICGRLGIPTGFKPISGALFGYAAEPNPSEKELSITHTINYV